MAKKKISRKKMALKSSSIYDDLTSVRFRVRGKLYEVNIGNELLVDGDDLHSQVERIPAVLGYFGAIVSLLEKEFKNKESLRKKVEALIDKRVRESGIIGETRIDKAIKRHPKWIEACIAVNNAREKYARAKNLYISLKEKSMILLSRSADIRNNPSDSILGVPKEDIISFDFFDDDKD